MAARPPVVEPSRPLIRRQQLRGPAWFAVLVPPSVPVLLWLRSDAVAVAFSSAAGALRSLALLAGLTGFAAFATNIVLSARVPAVERLFGGLDRMYRFHRRLAAAVAALLAAHVVLIVGAAAAAGDSVAGLLRPDAGWRVFPGVVAFAGFAAVLTVTVVVRLRHEPFLRVHRAFGAVFAVGAVHALRVSGVGSQVPLLRAYLAVLSLAAVAAWLYRSGLGRTLVRRKFHRVDAVRPRGADITEVLLEPVDEPLDFEPGQHVFLGVNDPAVTRELHPFSLASAPGEPLLRVAVKAVGDFTGAVPGVEPGAWVRVEGPYGGFWHGGAQIPRQIWIAGGIGVTPFLSMARGMPDGIQADLYYCAATAEALVFLDELEAVAADRPGLRVIANPDDAKGLLTAAEVARRSGDLSRAHVYLCGPPAMVRALPADLEAVGVARSRIHWEEFRLGGLRDR